ncbi:MAG: 3-isopropylmalate dehydratase small subunit [Alistipes sp.]|nr:3-isopropylmalate dehydratase small subunit [Alistipes sp.]MBO5984739.1 3-isopropylmalate dehydratase small subunit [Rikenellaceae bacterium]MBO7342928.1 3-isopropylmalate dehydratase small subunit [Alistipes sp.]
MRNKFTTLCSTVVPLPIENIDTDQIIPARFLKATTREGFGENLFRDWRFDKEGNPKEEFVMNSPKYKGQILVAGKNFGCGSSREHAAWAIEGAGFRAVVSSFFADIFRNNALNNGLLPVVVSEEMLAAIFNAAKVDPSAQLMIDLPAQTIELVGSDYKETFEIAPYKKECLMNGYDDVDFLVSIRSEIEAFEQK